MVRINSTVASHKLNIISTAKPVRQKVRHFHPDCHRIIQTEVDNLLRACFIREVKYPEWLANVVVVSKKGGKWRVCIDYTDLNEACPNDSFPLSRIDQIVDSAAGHRILLFLNAFSGYHQIPMHPPDAEKTTFIAPHRLYYHNVMHFHLDCHQIIQTEIENLLKAGFIREVKYPEWLTNVVMVPKKGGKWRVCIDYSDLNEACPKDSFPLLRIDQVVDSAVGHGILLFLNAFS